MNSWHSSQIWFARSTRAFAFSNFTPVRPSERGPFFDEVGNGFLYPLSHELRITVAHVVSLVVSGFIASAVVCIAS